MSRLITSELKATLGSSWNVAKTVGNGGAAKTIFAWIYLADFGGTSTSAETIVGFLNASNALKTSIYTSLSSGSDTLRISNEYDATSVQTVAAGTYDLTWVPTCCVFDTASNYWELYLGTSVTGATRAAESAWTNTVTQIAVGSSTLLRSFNIAHLTYWDTALSVANYQTLTTLDGGTYPNPTTIETGNILSYWAFETDTLVANTGSDLMTLAGSGSSLDANDPLVDAYGTSIQPNTAYLMNMMRG